MSINNNSPFNHLRVSDDAPETSPRFQHKGAIQTALPTFGGGAAAPDLDVGAANTFLKGLTPMEALEQYEGELTPFEMTELSTYNCIYAVGSVRVSSMRQIMSRDGFYSAHIGE